MFTLEDKAMIKGLREILDEGTFELKGKIVPGFIRVLVWVKNLDDRIIEDLKPKPDPVPVKPNKKAKK